jgi:hypothetical protein
MSKIEFHHNRRQFFYFEFFALIYLLLGARFWFFINDQMGYMDVLYQHKIN